MILKPTYDLEKGEWVYLPPPPQDADWIARRPPPDFGDYRVRTSR